MYRVLLVDDESIAQIGLQTFVDWEAFGFEIIATAANGAEALQRVTEQPIHLIVSDLVMPGMDGMEMTEHLRENGYTGEIVIISNYSDLNVVKRLLKMGVEDYILKISCQKREFEELLAELKKKLDAKNQKQAEGGGALSGIKKQTGNLKAFLLSGESEGALHEGTQACYQLFYLRILEQPERLRPERYNLILKSVAAVLPGFLKKEELAFVEISKTEFAIVADSAPERLEAEHGLALKLQRALKLYLMLESSVLCAENLPTLAELKQSFELCRKNSKLSFYGPLCGPAGSFSISSLEGLFHSVIMGNRYKRYLAEHRMDDLERELSMVLHNFQDKRVDPDEAAAFLSELVLISASYLYDHYGKELSLDYGALLRDCRTLAEAQKIQKQCFCEISEQIARAQEEERDSEPIDRILFYIEDNLGEKLSLSDVARHINMHPNYVSSYFKQKTGMTLTAYINQRKMEKAKELLLARKYKVKEVAGMVGIDDAFYFNRLFRKEFGVSPSQYVQFSDS